MISFCRTLSIAALLFFSAIPPVMAETAAPADGFEKTHAADIAAVEKYLNGISTLKARFVQTAPNGNQLSGDFMLKRPGRLRFQYDAPIKDFIVADGRFIYYYDAEMKEQRNTLISQSLADFFLRDDLSLTGQKVDVAGVERAGGLLIVTLTQTKDPLAGTLALGFTENPLQLKKWRVVDAQGQVTETELFDSQTGITFDKDLFRYYDPQRKEERFN